MSEKRKIQRFNLDEGRIWEAIEGLSPFKTTYTLDEVCEKLNEQQSIINKLKEENERLKSLHIDILEKIVNEDFYQEIFKEYLLENQLK